MIAMKMIWTSGTWNTGSSKRAGLQMEASISGFILELWLGDVLALVVNMATVMATALHWIWQRP